MKWNIACYIRLSREDGDLYESDSIINQRKLLTTFVEENFELQEYNFYTDENVTGTKFDRDQFNRLLSNIKKGRINCVIVKDLSRFGRNYIDAGMFIEDFFPRHNVRFISVLDGLDTFTDIDDTTSLMVRIKNLMHDNNSREISMKVRATNDLLRKQGKHISHAIYGYKKNPGNKYKLVVDTKVKHIVQNIFEWYASGMGVIRIAQKLNSMGISCCSEYKRTGQLHSVDKNKTWNPGTIRNIICNYSYIGCVHQGKTTTRNYKDRKKINLDIDQHTIIPNMHEAIIDKQLFDHVQHIIKSKIKTRTSDQKEKVYLFSGYLRCKECGSSLVRCPSHINGKDYVYYRCRRYKQGKKGCIHSLGIKHDAVYKIALQAVLDHIKYCCELSSLLKKIHLHSSKTNNSTLVLNQKITDTQDFILSQNKLKCQAYEDWKMGVITKVDYVLIKQEIDSRIFEKNRLIRQYQGEVRYYNEFYKSQPYWLNNIVQYRNNRKFSRKIVVDVIEKILVSQDQSVTIIFNRSSDIEKLNDFIKGYLAQR